MVIYFFDRVENIMGKGEKDGLIGFQYNFQQYFSHANAFSGLIISQKAVDWLI